jgi:hypothetical protein
MPRHFLTKKSMDVTGIVTRGAHSQGVGRIESDAVWETCRGSLSEKEPVSISSRSSKPPGNARGAKEKEKRKREDPIFSDDPGTTRGDTSNIRRHETRYKAMKTIKETNRDSVTPSAFRGSPRSSRRGFGARLASARDRQRLAERSLKERERVERMLAAAPSPVESSTSWGESRALFPEAFSDSPSVDSFGSVEDSVFGTAEGSVFGSVEASVASFEGSAAPRSLDDMVPRSCPVCGGSRVACDEVMRLGTLRLSECLRCEHRWTERGPNRWADVLGPTRLNQRERRDVGGRGGRSRRVRRGVRVETFRKEDRPH